VYLSKPIRLVDLITNVELMLGKKDKVKIGYEQTVKSNFCNDSLFIPDGNTYKRLLIDEIIFFEADGNYVSIVMTNGKELIATNLGTVEKQLDRDVFVRISRKHIINYHFIDSVNGTVVVICKKALPLGDTYKKRLMETIGVLRTKCE